MRIDFDDGGYVEFSTLGEKIFITVAAKSGNNEKVVNSADVTLDQFVEMAQSLRVEFYKKPIDANVEKAFVEKKPKSPRKKKARKKKAKKKASKRAKKKPVENDEDSSPKE